MASTTEAKEDELNPATWAWVNTVQSCVWIRYEVQLKDTLESTAEQFSITKDELLVANRLSSETVNADTEIITRLCNSTPTGTATLDIYAHDKAANGPFRLHTLEVG